MTDPSDLPDLTGETVLVTGATSGVGRDAATRLGRAGARVLVHGRDREAGREVVDGIEDAGGEASFHRADFTDLETVREFAGEVRATVGELDALCNNAGLYDASGESAQGYDPVLAVNHLAPYLLTHELVDRFAADARVVTTASEAHRSGSLAFDAVRRGRTGSSGFAAYADSKLCNVLFTRELARRLEGPTANCVHPGVIPGSGFARGVPFPLSLAWKATALLPGTDSVADGGRALATLAAGVDANGAYFDGIRETRPARRARDEERAERLWAVSADLVGVDPEWP